jgi:aspartate aminotransferase
MTGWRLGFSLWPDQLIDKARKLAVNAWSCVNAPAQYAALAALTGPQDEGCRRRSECPSPSILCLPVSGRPRNWHRCSRRQVAVIGVLGEGYIRLSYSTENIQRALKPRS